MPSFLWSQNVTYKSFTTTQRAPDKNKLKFGFDEGNRTSSLQKKKSGPQRENTGKGSVVFPCLWFVYKLVCPRFQNGITIAISFSNPCYLWGRLGTTTVNVRKRNWVLLLCVRIDLAGNYSSCKELRFEGRWKPLLREGRLRTRIQEPRQYIPLKAKIFTCGPWPSVLTLFLS